MMDTDAAQADETMREGMEIDAFLALGAVLALAGWGLTQTLALRPGLALELVGVESTVAVVAFWATASVVMAAVGLLAGARTVRYSPLLWLWGGLVGVALLLDALVLFGAVSPNVGRVLLWTPWPVVLGLGYLVTGVVAGHRNRVAYLVGSLTAGLVLFAALLFPKTVATWAFAATGVVHAAPLLVDAATDADSSGIRDADRGRTYEFRDLHDGRTDDRREEHS